MTIVRGMVVGKLGHPAKLLGVIALAVCVGYRIGRMASKRKGSR